MHWWIAAEWLLLAPAIWATVAQWLQWDGDRFTSALLALHPVLMAPVIPAAVISLCNWHWPALLACLATLLTFQVLAAPLVRRRPPPARRMPPEQHTFTIACANLLAYNPTPDRAAQAVAAADADVIVLVEPTPVLAAALTAELAPGDHPHRTEVLADDPSGVAVWSRLPFAAATVTRFEQQAGIDVVLQVGDTHVRLVAAHPYPPTLGARAWQRQLREFGRLPAATDGPLLLVGDFNACRWHPSFRRLLRAGFVAAHETLGSGWSRSWPAHRGAFPPPFVRLDHALLGAGLIPTAVREIRIPASDHTGFVTTLAVMDSGKGLSLARG